MKERCLTFHQVIKQISKKLGGNTITYLRKFGSQTLHFAIFNYSIDFFFLMPTANVFCVQSILPSSSEVYIVYSSTEYTEYKYFIKQLNLQKI